MSAERPPPSAEPLEPLVDPILPPPALVDEASPAPQLETQATDIPTADLHQVALSPPDFWEQAISEPAIVESDLTAPDLAELPALPASAASGLPQVSSPPAPPPPPSATEDRPSLRTGRWEPIQPLRPDVAPWRDRRISGASAIRPFGPECRFNWAQNAAQALGSLPANPAPPRAPAPPPSGLELVPREPRLTRSWALLSRFGGTKTEPADSPTEPSLAPDLPDSAGQDEFGAPVRASRRS